MSLLYGFKAWRQEEDVLRSTFGKWPARTYTAHCRGSQRNRQPRCKEPPGWDCTCGIYAFHDLEEAFQYSHIRWGEIDAVLGLLALSGRVIGHEEGMRAQHGEMVALWALHNHSRLTRRYGVEVLADPFEFQRRCSWLLESERRKSDGVS